MKINTIYYLLFIGSWLGTAMGTGLASMESWYVPFYAAGGLAVVLSVVLLALEPGSKIEKVTTCMRLISL